VPVAVPFQGTGPAMNALVGGQVDYMCDQIVSVVPQLKGGTIKGYAIGLDKRAEALPDVPTAKEMGVAFEVSAWNAMFAPKGTPKAALDKLNAAAVKALDDDNVRKRLLELGSVIPDKSGRTPEALASLVSKEIDRWTPIIKNAPQPK